MLRQIFSFSTVLLFSLSAAAQVGVGSLKGKVTDKESGELLPFVNIVIDNQGTQVGGAATDFDGAYYIKPIPPGTYDVLVSYVGYQPQKRTGVVINSDKITFLDIQLNSGVQLETFEVIKYTVPLINKDGGASGGTVTREDIARLPGRSANSIASTVAGTSDAGTGGGISIRGARSENTYYYIDGIKVPAGAGTGLPKSAIQEVQVITGGVPANYGDVTGGVISVTTRGPQREFAFGVDVLSSGVQLGDDVTDIVGLDKYAFNQVEASVSGPLLFRKDSLGNKSKPLLGFFFSGQFTDVKDNAPFYHGDVRVKRSVRDELIANPLSLLVSPTGDLSVVSNASFVGESDFEYLDTRQNAGSQSYLASGKIDIATTPTINLTLGGSADYADRQIYNYRNSMFNAENNYRYKDFTWRGFVKFTQRFDNPEADDEDAKKGGIANAYYSLQLDYTRRNQTVQDDVHEDNFFDYGYLGKFTTYKVPTYNFDGDLNAFIHNGFRDTLVTFVPSEVNADVAATTTQYFNLFPYQPFNPAGLFGFGGPTGPYENFDQIQSFNGLLNGQRPADVYGMWNNVGFLDDPNGAEYREFQRDQLRFSAIGSADIGDHAISVGVEYEQLTDRGYSLAPGGLWTRARQLANFHIAELDDDDLSAASVTYPFGTVPFYTFDRLVGDDQTFFDVNLRNALGLDVGGTDFIFVDQLDPSTYSLDMFSADELFNFGQGLVSYYGYDHLGNQVTGRPSFDSYFTGTDDNGQFTRIQAPFQPIYIAGYVMDKFAFDDIIFNVGVRVDRFDANQQVLKDPYLWQNAFTAGQTTNSSAVNNELSNRPSNIGDDFVVYVDNIESPTTVVGYRDGDTWYNSQGEVLADPSAIRTGSGIAPYLVSGGGNGDLPGSSLKADAFEDYDPQVNIMPRIAFSFPISDEAGFFAHYDVLTQRPTSNARLDLNNLAYIENSGNIQNNAALTPTKTIDFAFGFQQVLTKSSALKLEAFYRELRDMIQIRNVVEAWPRSYRSYANIDFGTVKGISASYDLRRTGNVSLRASYTLQFADGTGSGPNSGLNLVNSGQPNLLTTAPLNFDQRHRIQTTIDFRYGDGKDYNGPMLFGKPFLQNTGINLVAIGGSGTPYSSSSRIIDEAAGVGTHQLDGSVNGSRLPWLFTLDGQLDRNINLTFGKDKEGDKAKAANLNIYLLVTNILNSENVTGVWRATGNPDDDGYLAAPQWQQAISEQVDEQAYRDQYSQKVFNPFNYGAPRTIRLGVRLDF
jgi:hypothetical protein